MGYYLDCLVDKMSENGGKCQSVFPRALNGVLKCLVLSRNQKTFSQPSYKRKETRKYSHLRRGNQFCCGSAAPLEVVSEL